jgi:hypothetical protein
MADITFDSATLPDAFIGVPYSVKLATRGAATAITASSITAGALPAGLTLTQVAGAFDEISGTPTNAQEAGTFSFTVSLTDTAGAATNAMTMKLWEVSQLPGRDLENPALEPGLSEVVLLDGLWPKVQ